VTISGLSLQSDWRWQVRHSLRCLEDLERRFKLTAAERRAIQGLDGRMPIAITPYYADVIARSPALRKTMLPRPAEFIRAPGEFEDSLGEDGHSPVPGLVHTYPDKVLFLVTDRCAVYCRYCTRSRLAGSGTLKSSTAAWKRAIAYIRKTPAIRDVLVSGGEPLVLSDEKLDWLLRRLRAIPHVEIIRISTKVPAAMPQRITPNVVRVLRKYHPLWLSVHFTHPDELTPESGRACARLADAGIPMCSQTVLLKGVNDSPGVIKKLMQGLLRFRVKPYYLHQCDAVAGCSHFRTPVERGLEIVRSLHGFTSGYAVPTFMIDAPGGGGKVPVAPDYVAGREKGEWLLRNYLGSIFRYRDGTSRFGRDIRKARG